MKGTPQVMRHLIHTSIAVIAAAAMLGGPYSTTLKGQLAPPVTVPGIDRPVVVVTGEINGVMNWTSSNIYVLRGAVFVNQGATLNIEAGTLIAGEAGSVGTLIVLRGGRLNALGTRERPIVFTSDQPAGQRSRGDWGGIIINGRAPLNIPGGEGVGEAQTGIYGGDDPNDNSGTMRYVRVEFAGTEFSPDNELNGIAFQGVGRGGSYEYIQVHMNRDDAFEWFGGTADIKHAIASNAGDDSFDWTFGWTGRAQFLAVHQRSDDADWGIEADNNEFNNNLLPRANPQIYNMTICGDPDRNEGVESIRGVLFRRGTAVTFRNFLIAGSKTLGMQIDGTATIEQVNNGTTQIGAGVIWGPTTPLHASVQPFVANGRFPNVRVNVNGGLSEACFNHEAPNFQPVGIATLAGGQMAPIQPPNDGFFDTVTFIGAVPPAPEDDWTTGWTAYPQR
ncbi:MAG: T9SS C-terminal target domain-containing protein [Vicinamibacterales bacterium]